MELDKVCIVYIYVYIMQNIAHGYTHSIFTQSHLATQTLSSHKLILHTNCDHTMKERRKCEKESSDQRYHWSQLAWYSGPVWSCDNIILSRSRSRSNHDHAGYGLSRKTQLLFSELQCFFLKTWNLIFKLWKETWCKLSLCTMKWTSI